MRRMFRHILSTSGGLALEFAVLNREQSQVGIASILISWT